MNIYINMERYTHIFVCIYVCGTFVPNDFVTRVDSIITLFNCPKVTSLFCFRSRAHVPQDWNR